jgi:hypothetical protein
VGVVLGKAARQQLPGFAAIAAARHGELAARVAAVLSALMRDGEERFRFRLRHRQPKAEKREGRPRVMSVHFLPVDLPLYTPQ